jgi:predicted exporter
MSRTETALDHAVERGLIDRYALPSALWPSPEHQRANRSTAEWLESRRVSAIRSAVSAGFEPDSLGLTEGFFDAWKQFAAQEGPVWPSEPGARWVFRQFTARSGDRLLALGTATAAETATDDELIELSAELETSSGGRLFGWSLLSTSLLGLLQRDLTRVLLPMAVILIVMLGLAFRRPGEIVLSFATLAFSLLCLSGVMVVVGWSWNLMNVMALSLLFGAGVDYSIHIQLALQRHRGDVAHVGRTVGKAILLCGASTASGFGTLGFASNAGLASLGRVCAAGVLITALVSVFLLPVWWSTVAGRGTGPAAAHGRRRA